MGKMIRINLLIDEELLAQIDKAAISEYQYRSDYIRQAILQRMKRDYERYQRSLQ